MAIPEGRASLVDRKSLHALGVLVPLRFHPVKILPGRHPLGRPGAGMRLLRTRPYVPGEDNPRDIDKFSPPDERLVQEWEEEAQASILLLADSSMSMSVPSVSALRNACILQLTYSLWRAGDRTGLILFDNELRTEVRAANLRTQMERINATLRSIRPARATDLLAVLRQYLQRNRKVRSDLVFIVSDFLGSGSGDANEHPDWRNLLNQFNRNVVPVVTTYTVPGGARGVMKLRDTESNARRLVRLSASRIRRMNDDEKSRIQNLSRSFRSAGLNYMTVSDQRQIYPQLAKLARLRRQGPF